jgi:hypothetical protein
MLNRRNRRASLDGEAERSSNGGGDSVSNTRVSGGRRDRRSDDLASVDLEDETSGNTDVTDSLDVDHEGLAREGVSVVVGSVTSIETDLSSDATGGSSEVDAVVFVLHDGEGDSGSVGDEDELEGVESVEAIGEVADTVPGDNEVGSGGELGVVLRSSSADHLIEGGIVASVASVGDETGLSRSGVDVTPESSDGGERGDGERRRSEGASALVEGDDAVGADIGLGVGVAEEGERSGEVDSWGEAIIAALDGGATIDAEELTTRNGMGSDKQECEETC